MKKTITPIQMKPKVKETPQEHGKKRVAAYTRVSTEQDEQLNSLSVQQRYFEELINKNPEWINVGIYYDEGISGTSLKKREGFNRLINDALDGKIDLILVKSISRFARNTVDALQTIRALKAKGVTVFFEKENIDSMDMKSEFILTIMSSLAQEESQSLSENIKWGLHKVYREGKVWVPYTNFLGYKRGNKYELVIDKEQAKFVRLIYRLFLEGRSPFYIARMFDSLGIPTMRKGKWASSTIKSILENEKYCGDALLQKTFITDFMTHTSKVNEGELPAYYVKNDHPAIIRRATWEEVQHQISLRTIHSSDVYPFSTRLYCEVCGEIYRRKPWNHEYYTHTIQTWICSNKYNDVRCKNVKLFEKQLNVIFHDAILHLISSYDDIFTEVVPILQKSVKTKTRQTQILRLLKKKRIPNHSSYEELMWRILIPKVDVHTDKRLTFHFIDESTLEYPIPKWKIKEHDVD